MARAALVDEYAVARGWAAGRIGDLDLGWSLGRGFVIGFAIAAAIGPIGLLCIRRTLAKGRAIGAVSGLGRPRQTPSTPR